MTDVDVQRVGDSVLMFIDDTYVLMPRDIAVSIGVALVKAGGALGSDTLDSDPSQTSTNVDALPAAPLSDDNALSRPSGAGSSSSPSVAPTDSLPDAKGHPKPCPTCGSAVCPVWLRQKGRA